LLLITDSNNRFYKHSLYCPAPLLIT